MSKYRAVRSRKKISPSQRKKREEAKRKRESLKKCNSVVQNGEGSTTSIIAEKPNGDILERISANCANCASHIEDGKERNVKFKKILEQTNEIEIIDAIFYIYGLTVADWSKILTVDRESDFASASEIVFSNGIPFCSKCTSALENVHASHKILKELGHNESLFAKALNKKYSCETESKLKCKDENEVSSLNNSNLSDEEMEFKEEGDFDLQDASLEVNSELDHLEHPLMVDDLNDLLSSVNSLNSISFNVSESINENALVARNENNISLTETQCTTTRRFIPKILQRHRRTAIRSIKNSNLAALHKRNEELSWSENEISNLNKNRFLRRKSQKYRCSVQRKTLPLPKPTPDHSFNVSCCDESFVSNKVFINHQLDSHLKERPKLIKCNICEVLIPKKHLFNHMKTYKKFRKQHFNCKICSTKFTSASSMTQHLQTHDSLKYAALICDVCGTPTQSDFQLVVHKVRNHSESEIPESKHVFTCNICNSKIKGIVGLRVHCNKHNPAKQVTCHVCQKLFPSQQNLHSHMKRLHLDSLDYKYPCSKCNMKFSSEIHLAAHHATSKICHFPKPRSVCEKCGKSVSTRHMNRHKQLHEDIESSNKELFRCPQCGKLLKHRDSLQKHRRREHPVKEKLFFCEKCGKTTKNMTNMRIHMKVHEKD